MRERERELLAYRGLAVFPRKEGGRGVHIESMVPGWHCALLMQTSERLHGSVLPDVTVLPGLALSHLRCMRVVTYPLKRVEELQKRLAAYPSQMTVVKERSDAWMHERMTTCGCARV